MQQSLARRYRPALFQELVGQDGAAKALTSAIRLGRIPQGVLFTGVRGIGKTTTARLYAKALNCEARGEDAEPCNQCESCIAITKGAHEDVLEIDGASNTGVGDVRALQETLAYVPQRSSYRIYIIDEVHMLSQAAFNALLKTLEEPPAHVVFIFATTELEKVPATIVGRCQTFHLNKLPVATIRERLASILAKEDIKSEDKALSLIAREGHGSMRDALTLLDQAIAIGGGEITLACLGPIVSKLSSAPYLDLLAAFVSKDAKQGLLKIEQLDAKGAVFGDVVEQLAAFARHAFIVRDLGVKALDTALLGLDDEELTRLAEIAGDASPLDLNRIFRTLVRCRGDLDGSAIDRYILENYLFEWCLDPGLPDLETLLQGGANQRGEPRPADAVRPLAPGGFATAAPSAPRSVGKSLLAALNESLASPSPAPQSMMQTPARVATKSLPKIQNRSQAPSANRNSERVTAASRTQDLSQPVSGLVATPHSEDDIDRDLPPQLSPPTEACTALSSLPAASSDESREVAEKLQTSIQAPLGAMMAFPETWRALVDAWKREKPLQARKLEDTHPLRYTPGDITIAVDTNSPASVLLAREEQQRIKAQFRELFGFCGHFNVIVAEDARSESETKDLGATPLPESILTEREREAHERRRRIRDETENGIFAKEALAVLGGKVEDILVR